MMFALVLALAQPAPYSPPATYRVGSVPAVAPAPSTKIDRVLATLAESSRILAQSPPPVVVPPPRVKAPALDLPAGAVKYTPARFSQRIAVTNDRDTIDPVLIVQLPDTRWHQSGGMLGVTGYRSDKYRTLPVGKGVREEVWSLPVKNSLGHYQRNWGLWRVYPVGTRFDDVLINTATGKVFEHRVREKLDTGWTAYVLDSDPAERPKGYAGLKVSCQSCHKEPGSGGYAVGLVPGSDQTFSDELPWHLVGRPGNPIQTSQLFGR